MTRRSAASVVAVALLGTALAAAAAGQERLDPRVRELGLDLPGLVQDTGGDLPERVTAAAGIQQFQLLSTSVDLEPVSLAELLSLLGGTALDMGAWRGAGSLDARLSTSDPVVEREERFLWAARVRWSDLGDVVVQYELEGADGSAGALSRGDDPESRIPAVVDDAAPLWVPINGNFLWLIGGPRFRLSLGEARRAGTYSGTLTVTVSSL